jgi:hypothetical protein
MQAILKDFEDKRLRAMLDEALTRPEGMIGRCLDCDKSRVQGGMFEATGVRGSKKIQLLQSSIGRQRCNSLSALRSIKICGIRMI